MNLIPNFEAQATLSACNPDPQLKSGRFRWSVHIPLPFFWPDKKCVHRKLTILDEQFELAIHNHFNQCRAIRKGAPWLWFAWLVEKNQKLKIPLDFQYSVHALKGVAVFAQEKEFADQESATANAADKINACFDVLSELILNWQKAAPYNIGYMARPVSMREVDEVYHNTLYWNEQTGRWETVASFPVLNIDKHSNGPRAYSELPESENSTLADVANKLLAEASVALYGNSYRTVIVSSYSAVDNLAAQIHKQRKKPKGTAEKEYKESPLSYRLRCQLKDSCGRGLKEDLVSVFTRFKAFEKTRHSVVHEGYKPTRKEAHAAYDAACEVVQWLCGIAELPIKPMSVSAENVFKPDPPHPHI
jgi:hypothetical protein